ncbi:DUF3305 domain-containing protein [Marinibacterium profundimaris]|uniref:Molybdopterin-guanine dinucleotide biosynthesis protein MobA n=1 Tax=Marinibacterium profundimaris TaxID=1679460 RepID=A0A225NLG5_9RHOB|nr:DUF3305 domain-containing protein [Marinibacterium profundimaris]OWU74763.1 molybdopterin-guanine dinucleotide biosynthesis protein MobA [Marinibacterium profundimaris]
MPVGVVMRRRPGVTRWARWDWRAVAVLPGARPADWQELRREGEVVEYHAATPILELHGAETEAYVHGLGADVPGVFVILRKGSGDRPLNVVRVTASPYEAQDYGDNGEDIVEKVPMPPGLAAWVQSFVEAYHQDQAFVKRRRDKARVDRVEDGKGDARIPQAADVYRSPAAARRRRLS